MRLTARAVLIRAIAPVAMMAAIFYLSAQPLEDPDFAWWEVVVRKLGHLAGYAALTGLWAWTLAGAIRRPVGVAAMVSLLYAVSDEYHQTFVEGRHGTAIDVGLDAVGIALASLIIASRRPAGRGERSNRA